MKILSKSRYGHTTEDHKTNVKQQISIITIFMLFAFTIILFDDSNVEASTDKTATGWYYPTDVKAQVSHGGDYLDNGCGDQGQYPSEGKDMYFPNRIHLGVDYPAHLGWPVYAIGDGTVTAVMPNWDSEWHAGVAVRHTTAAGKNFTAIYGHLVTDVSVGDKVYAGKRFATVSAYSYGSHLHFGIFPNGLPATMQGAGICKPGQRLSSLTNGSVDPHPWLARNPRQQVLSQRNATASSSNVNKQAIDLCTDRKGRMHLFTINSSGRVLERYERTVGGNNFTAWQLLPGQKRAAHSDIACAKNKDGTIVLFYIGNDARIYSATQSRSLIWSSSTTTGLKAHDALAAELGQNGRITVMYNQYKTRRLLTLEQRSANSRTFYLDAHFPRDKTAKHDIELALNQDGRLEASFIGLDNRMYGTFQTKANSDTWFCCFRHGTKAVKDGIGMTANKDGRLELIYINTNNSIDMKFQRWAGGNWWCCANFKGSWAANDVALKKDAYGRLHGLHIGGNGVIYHAHQYSAGSRWTSWKAR